MKAAQLFYVSGLVSLITGAASGIGLAYAEVDNGASLAFWTRTRNPSMRK